VASFRDRINPEAIRFPGELRVKVLIVCGLLVDVLCILVATHGNESIWKNLFDAAVIAIAVGFKVSCWPYEIVSDQSGLHSNGRVPGAKINITWGELGAIRPAVHVRGFGPRVLGLPNDAIELVSRDGSSVIAHTPCHPDRARLLREPHLRGVTVDTSALT
jgi:hypothetical protein